MRDLEQKINTIFFKVEDSDEPILTKSSGKKNMGSLSSRLKIKIR